MHWRIIIYAHSLLVVKDLQATSNLKPMSRHMKRYVIVFGLLLLFLSCNFLHPHYWIQMRNT
jgi:hypothetical protein